MEDQENIFIVDGNRPPALVAGDIFAALTKTANQ
jgi:hypothetical protein